MPAVTPTLQARATSSTSSQASASSSFLCSGSNSLDSRCEKPSPGTALEIGLGVGIPVFVIACVLGFFVLKNYRKEKKEAMSHDPDFDENGDATALPDFPAFSKEDPFGSHAAVDVLGPSGGYPFAHVPSKPGSTAASGPLSVDPEKAAPVDAFVLPYQTQLGSKTSLHEFARSLADLRTYQRGSGYLSLAAPAPARGSPHPTRPGSVLRLDRGGAGPDTYHDASPGGGAAGSTLSGSSGLFGVQYEGELKSTEGTSLPGSRRGRNGAAHADSDLESVADSDGELGGGRELGGSGELEGNRGVHSDREAGADRNLKVDRNLKFDSEPGADSDLGADREAAPGPPLRSPFGDRHVLAAEPLPEPDMTPHVTPALAVLRAPRMSQFDMLHNASDDGEPAAVSAEPQAMSAEQEEQLARMKSVYNVYFDRPASVASHRDAPPAAFEPDSLAPLPPLDMDHLPINAELKGDTAYDRRRTATSSIYADGMHEPADGQALHPHQQFLAASLGYMDAQGAQADQPRSAGPDPEHVPSPADYLPLKALPNASDIRNSTIETYTLYEPTTKVASPSMRHQQGYFDAPLASLHMGSQASFATSGLPRSPYFGELPPMLRDASSGQNPGSAPSPSQLSRKSVVMLNPVSEITSLRTFKPAGSLPSGMVAPRSHSSDELSTVDDLVAENRKSAVRRMMNLNF
ncbi:hypothetical protein METBIDRAFT_10007 [Metschnikowia bicuspidata var. bicuspidata NRRL YB-4993]|uniref:Uncharacterized protein n=1 Tax=Metschnikowia bicuspidata var. bicuspidata NRRL YB-4993 TaxID=869754 RepID=A0A1A0HIE6_9ASCO|nr:hypothetical protein METBIDRAFT_10007 [Metschnikowia bicuspidata var. bicuspidata NRRL YB-4993]OBA23780.1 hypothetical protein METBIDRAFT_10007 [Metschnikowia bicuspidata var. bicuspidata NRRL YB-4993]